MSATIEGRAVATMVASIAESSVITTSEMNSRRRDTARGGAVGSEVINGEVAFSILGRDHRRGLVRGPGASPGPTGALLEGRPRRRRQSNGNGVNTSASDVSGDAVPHNASGADAHCPLGRCASAPAV